MEKYIFVCIGTNRLIEDSFGPRVGEILEKNFSKYANIQVLGTMKTPIHLYNAPIFWDYLKKVKNNIILIDSALGRPEEIGKTYISCGGIELGKAFGKAFYFPASLNIKTVVGDGNSKNLRLIHQLAQNIATVITKGMQEIA